MDDIESKCAFLRAQIAATESQLAALRQELESAEKAASTNRTAHNRSEQHGFQRKWPLFADEYRRYGRQMIVPQLGLEGQLKLRSSSVLLVGAGGLGCPAAVYLAGAGVGKLGMVDDDTVDISNLHRQVLHRTRNVGKLKVDSAIEYLKELNPHPEYVAHKERLSPQNAPAIFEHYDVILDCTDNPATRYLISDTAVLLNKPLVSASALRTEGQLAVLNYPAKPPGDATGSPCYRCVFPIPPPPDSVVSCADGGILGPVVGIMGVLQALETIKVITGSAPNPDRPSLHIFSAYSPTPWRTIRLRSRRANCAVCSCNATITLDTLRSGSTDYVQFCGTANASQVLSPIERISADEYQSRCESAESPILIDVRDETQFNICSLDNSINVPITRILNETWTNSDRNTWPSWVPPTVLSRPNDPIYVVCRQGNDSQLAVRRLKELGLDRNGERFIGDIRGGLKAWKTEVDPDWPEY